MDMAQILKDFEDKVFKYYSLDIFERGLLYYLFRQTRLNNLDSATIPLSKIVNALGISEFKAREAIRSLATKGCIDLEQTRNGHFVKVYLPEELNIPKDELEINNTSIEEIDFYSGRKYLSSLLKREQNKCFYCLRDITLENCELDHVISQINGGNNTYTNIVASCHHCNTKKQGNYPDDYLRSLLRKSIISENEFENRLKAIELLQKGELKPEL